MKRVLKEKLLSPGLKTNLIKNLKVNVANLLAKTDWYVTRNIEKSIAIPSAISTHRDLVRTKQAEHGNCYNKCSRYCSS